MYLYIVNNESPLDCVAVKERVQIITNCSSYLHSCWFLKKYTRGDKTRIFNVTNRLLFTINGYFHLRSTLILKVLFTLCVRLNYLPSCYDSGFFFWCVIVHRIVILVFTLLFTAYHHVAVLVFQVNRCSLWVKVVGLQDT